MIGLLRELPDYAFGGAAAAAVWYGAVYATLAPRAMDNDLQADVYPACLSELKADQERTLSKAEERERRRLESQRENIRRELNAKLGELSQAKIEVQSYSAIKRTYDQSALTKLIPNVLPRIDVPSVSEIEAIEKTIRAKRQALSQKIDIKLPRAPSDQLLHACVCAGQVALTGKRNSYALSLASFRLVSPDSIASLKSSVSEIIRADACGTLPWKAV